MSAIIIDYEMGNLGSVQKALNSIGIPNEISNNHDAIKNARYVILPGVGSFQKGMENLKRLGLKDLLTQEVLVNKKPFLGICLGMQLLATYGTEPEHTEGLDWIKGSVVKIPESGLRIPHMGWDNIDPKQEFSEFKNLESLDFYFIHSYHFEVEQAAVISSTVQYGAELVSSIHHNNIVATQFHPEKSQKSGIQVLKNFFEAYA